MKNKIRGITLPNSKWLDKVYIPIVIKTIEHSQRNRDIDECNWIENRKEVHTIWEADFWQRSKNNSMTEW